MTRQVASEVVERVDQLHGEDAVYYCGRVIVIKETSCLLQETKPHIRCQEE